MARTGTHEGDAHWGWWLRGDKSGYEDEQGRRWQSVRDAFWQGRLGFPPVHFVEEQQELLFRVLSASDAGYARIHESCKDLFAGDMMFWRFYQCWLNSIGMTETSSRSDPLYAPLSPEGRSALLMLRATREPDWETLPMPEVLDAVVAASRSSADESREDALRAFERQIGVRRYSFARERVGQSHLITLTGIGAEARMPTRRVTWSLSFTDERARDDLYAWLAERIDRWDDWGQMAYAKGAAGFTAHLLTLVVAAGSLAT